MKNKSSQHINLVNLLRYETPDERQKLLNDVDYVICEVIGVKYEDLPWRNIDASESDWNNYIRKLRLAITKTLFELNNKNRTLH